MVTMVTSALEFWRNDHNC